MDDGSLGSGFVVKLIAAVIGITIAALLSLVFVSNVFAKWGLIGGAVVLCAILLFAGWLFDRREARQDREFGN